MEIKIKSTETGFEIQLVTPQGGVLASKSDLDIIELNKKLAEFRPWLTK